MFGRMMQKEKEKGFDGDSNYDEPPHEVSCSLSGEGGGCSPCVTGATVNATGKIKKKKMQLEGPLFWE